MKCYHNITKHTFQYENNFIWYTHYSVLIDTFKNNCNIQTWIAIDLTYATKIRRQSHKSRSVEKGK